MAYLLLCAGTLAARPAEEELRPHGLSVRQFGLLAQLRLEPELSMSDLARQLGVTRQSLHELVGALEQAGHVRRLPGSTGRTRRVEMSAGTEYLLSRLEAPLERTERALLSGFTPDERETLRTLLQRLLAQVTDDEAWLPED
ncbi:MarR family transcriptional regulator [Actinomadura sp. KC345]|nr:MarR family transcriptional regulator [Actinomadura sp. KC345]